MSVVAKDDFDSEGAVLAAADCTDRARQVATVEMSRQK
jgi:hypothetical protein